MLCGDGVHRPVGREAQVVNFLSMFSLRVMKYFYSVWQWPVFYTNERGSDESAENC